MHLIRPGAWGAGYQSLHVCSKFLTNTFLKEWDLQSEFIIIRYELVANNIIRPNS